MSVELLQTLSLVSFIVAGVLLLVGIALFFLLDVPKLYGDISGRTAKKAIEAIRQQNEESGGKTLSSGPLTADKKKRTDKIGNANKNNDGTQKLHTKDSSAKASETTVLKKSTGETTVLTGELPANETTLLTGASSANETALLTKPSSASETTLLTSPSYTNKISAPANSYTGFESNAVQAMPYTVELEMSFTGSSEIIE